MDIVRNVDLYLHRSIEHLRSMDLHFDNFPDEFERAPCIRHNFQLIGANDLFRSFDVQRLRATVSPMQSNPERLL